MKDVFLNEMGVVCALGDEGDTVARALFDARGPGNAATDDVTPGRPLVLGRVLSPLPSMDDQPVALRGRNNALLRRAFAQIAPAVAAAIERHGAHRVAVVLGTSTSGIGEAEHALHQRALGQPWPQGFHYAQQEMGTPARFVRELSGARGPAWTVSTACSSSAKAMMSAARLLRAGIADVVIAGGADSLCRFTVEGFSALESVSAQRCNPFSRNRDGINIGEGAGLFLMSLAPGPVRLSGWGETSDAHHLSAPDPAGTGAIDAMGLAIARAGLRPADIDYVNLHGTATRQNDAMESRAMQAVFGAPVAASATKPLTGHTLGAAGAIEAALCWLTLARNPDGLLPPHWWDGEADRELPPLALVAPGQRAAHRPRHLLSHSFAFGGSNAVLAFSGE